MNPTAPPIDMKNKGSFMNFKDEDCFTTALNGSSGIPPA